ncbi:rRNA biogenesis protein RRP36 domain-containing protein [Ditylenchus destructor]|uniref:rRNA biogenesis protein RRP36 n=1 Tax=Ditylenchus destructor TaxID=166010 RepID=A0AAD4R425_9BILA|nr:rRNA biogenesis protein RRP36 domain-containing protein [Ditylenchus destructor]
MDRKLIEEIPLRLRKDFVQKDKQAETEGKEYAKKAHTKSKPKSAKAPREESSKKPVSKLRQIVDVGYQKRIDPRFAVECGGDFDGEKFNKDYDFLNDLKKNEILELKKAYRTARREDPEKAARIKTNILRLENQQKSVENSKLFKEVRAELRQQNIERMNQGLKPVYLNNQEMKKYYMEKKLSKMSSSSGNMRPYLNRKMQRWEEKHSDVKVPAVSLNEITSGVHSLFFTLLALVDPNWGGRKTRNRSIAVLFLCFLCGETMSRNSHFHLYPIHLFCADTLLSPKGTMQRASTQRWSLIPCVIMFCGETAKLTPPLRNSSALKKCAGRGHSVVVRGCH